MTFQELLNKRYVLLDGGFGSELFKNGFPVGQSTALAVFTHPVLVEKIHRSYIEAGSDIIYADTFAANRYKLEGSGYSVKEAVFEAVKIAKKAAQGTDTLVALDVSTLGRLLAPAGDLSFDEAYEAFAEIMKYGEEAGAELIALETFTDLREIRIAALAAKENTSLPVIATVSFEENGATLNGNTSAACALTLAAVGVDATGLNCSLGPDKLGNAAKGLFDYSPVPVIIKPNAGLPDPETGVYSMGAKEFAALMLGHFKDGALILGGCCGTTPEYIKEIKAALDSSDAVRAEHKKRCAVCGTGSVVELDMPRMIGERINPTGKKLFKQALENHDIDYIVNQGLEQIAAEAEILDVNVGHSGIDEEKMMLEVIPALQAVITAPLQIDSADFKTVESALRIYTGKAIVNSVNGKDEVLDTLLPVIKKYGAAVVGLTLDENGIPDSAEKRIAIAEKIIDRALYYGIDRDDIYIDCLTLTVSADAAAAKTTLKAVKAATEKLGVKTVLGVSNVSFGLPQRETVNAAFLNCALENGLSLPIMNPNNKAMAGAFFAFRLLHGFDAGSAQYIRFAAAAPAEGNAPAAEESDSGRLARSVEKGLAKEGAALTEKMLASVPAADIINTVLIPALDKIGTDFEKGRIFLPQLIMAADAAGACFDIIKAEMKKKNIGAESKGDIILATVRGDVHDIGKNIVKTVLENYGFNVIDLGKDVDAAAVVEAQKKTGARLVGLSALMTTTLPSMEQTVKALHDAGADCRIMVGGAVLTPEYAEKIGADYYAKDAKMSADIAKSVYGI